jgi:hypothetical protein
MSRRAPAAPVTVVVLLAAAGALLAGCGSQAPRPRPRPTKLQVAQATHEYPSPKPPPQHARGDAPSPVAAIRAFATAYINWTASSVSGQLKALAADSIGQARSAMELAAAQTAGDYELQRGGIANSGTVEAVAPLLGRGGRYIVVTLESTTATNTTAYQGLQPAWHLTVATVSLLRGRQWVVSGWQPEN